MRRFDSQSTDTMVDLHAILEKYLYDEGVQFKALNFGGLKVKFSNMIWTQRAQSQESSAPRVVKMENNSCVHGTGLFKIEKEGKPITTLTINKGILKGFPNRGKFTGPEGVTKAFMARVDQLSTTNVDYVGLFMETSVPLPPENTAYATIQNETKTYLGDFSCTASLTGNVVVVMANDSITQYNVSSFPELSRDREMNGSLSVELQNNHSIVVR